MLGKHTRNLGGHLFPVILALAVLTGCTNLSQTTSLPPVEASPTSAVVMPSQPSTPAATATPRITLVAKYTPTPRLITPAPAEGTFTDQSVVSPDGNWTALPAFEILSDGYRVSLRVFNKDESVVWTPVDYKGDGVGYIFPFPKRWSSDSRYFYYVESIAGDGCDFFPTDQSWLGLDTQTGKIETVDLPAGRGHMSSPDESILAFTSAAAPLELVLLDVQSRTEQKVNLLPDAPENQSAQGGRIVWSPDGKKLILAVSSANFCDNPEVKFYLMSVHLEDLKVTVLIQGKVFNRPLKWSTDGKVLVMDWNSKSWWMDTATGEITSAPVD